METIHGLTETIHEYTVRFQADDGTVYAILARGDLRGDGMWEGWLEFQPLDGGLPQRTGRETTQPNRDALVYWASGLEPIYFEGAFERAGGS
jgi:hypothetical protein